MSNESEPFTLCGLGGVRVRDTRPQNLLAYCISQMISIYDDVRIAVQRLGRVRIEQSTTTKSEYHSQIKRDTAKREAEAAALLEKQQLNGDATTPAAAAAAAVATNGHANGNGGSAANGNGHHKQNGNGYALQNGNGKAARGSDIELTQRKVQK